MVYNSPNIHDYLYYTDYTYIQNIPFLSPGFPAKAHANLRHGKELGQDVLSWKSDSWETEKACLSIVMDIMGLTLAI